MRNLIIFIGILSASLGANAQSAITLTRANITGLSQTITHSVNAGTAGITAPTIGANQSWDFSSLVGITAINSGFVPANFYFTNTFSKTAVADSSTSEVVIKLTEEVHAPLVYDIDNNGFFIAGRIISAQNYSEAPLTGQPQDSSFWPFQTYIARENLIAFPATMGSSWTSKTVHPLNSTITIVSYKLKNAPVKVVVHSYIKDTVVGWGTLKVPSSKNASIPYDVLLVRRHTVTSDSFYLNNQPAPVFVMAGFGSKQNDTTSNTYQEFFYRSGNGMPLLTLNFNSDSTYTSPGSANYTVDSVKSGIEDASFNPDLFKIYPNPSSGGLVNFQLLKKNDLPWKLIVVNALGQEVKTIPIEGTGNLNRNFNMNGNEPGLYFVRVTDEIGTTLATGKLDISQ